MELRLAQIICEVIAECGEDAEVYESYRGRGMSEHTAGVVCDDLTTIIRAIINCAGWFSFSDGEAVFDVTNLSSDHLGKRAIIY